MSTRNAEAAHLVEERARRPLLAADAHPSTRGVDAAQRDRMAADECVGAGARDRG